MSTKAAGGEHYSIGGRFVRRAKRVWRWLWRSFALLLASYVLFLLLGFVPSRLNRPLPPPDDSILIYVRNNPVHTDLVLPVVEPKSGVDWRTTFPQRDFRGDVDGAEYVSIGWGNRKFFVETPTWAELKFSTACRALIWPSETVLHVEYLAYASPSADMHPLRVSQAEYHELVAHVNDTVGERTPAGAATLATDFSYHANDRFYQSRGSYHLLNTCNQWTGRGMRRAGLPTGIWTPLQQQVVYWLPASP